MVQTDAKTLDILIPAYNEEGCIDESIIRLEKVRNDLRPLEVSCIFINDGSSDKTLEKLEGHAARRSWVKVIDLSRNFGHQMALTAGLDYSSGDLAAVMDADLQDPPELLARMIERLKAGNDVVYGKRRQRSGETVFKLWTAKLFYRFIRLLCRVDIPENTGEFRVMTRRVVESVTDLRETHRFTRGFVPWVGFKSEAFYYDREKRYAGETKYPFKKMLGFALDSIFSFSYFPLQVATYLGFFLVFLGGIGLSCILYLKIFRQEVVAGLTTMLAAVVTLSGVQILVLGMMGEYIGRIFEEVKKRPLYVVRKTRNLEDAENARTGAFEKRRRFS